MVTATRSTSYQSQLHLDIDDHIGFKALARVPPPQLAAVVEGSDALLLGKALDLGCGTGTNSIYMADSAGMRMLTEANGRRCHAG